MIRNHKGLNCSCTEFNCPIGAIECNCVRCHVSRYATHAAEGAHLPEIRYLLPWYREESRRGKRLAMVVFIPGIMYLLGAPLQKKRVSVPILSLIDSVDAFDRADQRAGRGQSLARIAEQKAMDAVVNLVSLPKGAGEAFNALGKGVAFLLWVSGGQEVSQFANFENIGRRQIALIAGRAI